MKQMIVWLEKRIADVNASLDSQLSYDEGECGMLEAFEEALTKAKEMYETDKHS